MKLPSILKRKKLHAATAVRRSRAGLPVGMDYEEMGEPNMKLSRALLIVLLLHIVAVAGIIAFNTIKTREAANTSSPDPVAPVASTPAVPMTESSASAPNEITQVAAQTETKLPAKIAEPPKTGESMKAADPPKPIEKATRIPDSGKIYTVVKGDNPVTIARHFHVEYAALLELNQITDPRKLQIGTKLHIPAREESKGKSD